MELLLDERRSLRDGWRIRWSIFVADCVQPFSGIAKCFVVASWGVQVTVRVLCQKLFCKLIPCFCRSVGVCQHHLLHCWKVVVIEESCCSIRYKRNALALPFVLCLTNIFDHVHETSASDN